MNGIQRDIQEMLKECRGKNINVASKFFLENETVACHDLTMEHHHEETVQKRAEVLIELLY